MLACIILLSLGPARSPTSIFGRFNLWSLRSLVASIFGRFDVWMSRQSFDARLSVLLDANGSSDARSRAMAFDRVGNLMVVDSL